MKKRVWSWLVVLLLASFLTSCATGSPSVWIPPSSPETPAASQALVEPSPTSRMAPTPASTAPAGDPPGDTLPVNDPAATATPFPDDPVSTGAPLQLSPTITPEIAGVTTTPILYYAQAADTLPVVAVRFGVEPSEIASTEPLPPAAFLKPGQILFIPRRLLNTTSSQRLMPDSEIVYSPSALDFDIAAYVNEAGGYLSRYQEWLKSTGTLSGAQVVQRVALENSINPRLLLGLLEYHSHWVTGEPLTRTDKDYPMGYIDPGEKGLYRQLVWAINQISVGYYAYREGRLTEIHFQDGVSARLAPDLNAGTAALQYYFAQVTEGQDWLYKLDPEKGFPALYASLFGNPWERALTVEPLYPPGTTQPPLTLPFTRNITWSFTGGPHGAWEHDGAYAALDFAPGSTETGCVPSNAWVVASASGRVVRSGTGIVVIDMDGDGHEQTGWVLTYLHVATEGRVSAGSWVDAGDPLGHPSCEGGFSTGTHVHIARKFNGEWVPAAGPLPFDLGGWISQGTGVAYKGTLTRDGVILTACTCSSASTFITRTDNDP